MSVMYAEASDVQNTDVYNLVIPKKGQHKYLLRLSFLNCIGFYASFFSPNTTEPLRYPWDCSTPKGSVGSLTGADQRIISILVDISLIMCIL